MSILTQVMKSSGFMVAGSFFQKVAGLLSTLILARILTPEDFGIVAFLALTVNFFNVIAITGTQQYILSKDTITKDDLNTALTLDLIMKGVFWGILVLGSGYISSYFNMQVAQLALIALSSVLIIKALKNPGFTLHQKDLNYSVLFKLELIAKVISVITVIALGIYTKSFWAIVIGDILLATIVTIGSYILHPHRPTLTLRNIGPQWNFSKWMFSKGIIGFSKANLDQMFVTKMFAAGTVGGFYMARDIALLPAFDLLNKAVAPLLPAFAKSKNDNSLFEYRVSFSIILVNLLAIPTALAMYLHAASIISILLGDQWLHIEPIFISFIPIMYLSCLTPIVSHALVAKQIVKLIFWTDVIALLMHVIPFLLLSNITLESVVLIRACALSVSLMILLVGVRYACGLSIIRLTLLSTPSIIAAVFSYYLHTNLDIAQNNILGFVMSAFMFGLIYLTLFIVIALPFRKTETYSDFFKLLQPLTKRLLPFLSIKRIHK